MTTISGPSVPAKAAIRTGGALQPRPTSPNRHARRCSIRGPRWAALAFAAPLLVYLVVFYAYPLVRNVDLSLHDYTIRAFVQGDPEFVGLANFREVFQSATFPMALRNTSIFVLVSLIFQYTIGLALAIFFQSSFRLSSVLRGMFLIPWLLPLIVSASTWSWMLNSSNGIVNSALQAFGIGQINWLTDPQMAIWSVTIANIWLGIPFNLVILHSGLQNIPGEVYEAASLDGANVWQRFWQITFPLLRPVSAITLLLGFIYTLKVVDVVWVMTTGGPANASTTLAVWSYREAFGTGQPDFSPAATVGNILILIALGIGLIYIQTQRMQERES